MMPRTSFRNLTAAAAVALTLPCAAFAQSAPAVATPPGPARVPPAAPITPPEDYIIGPNDVLTILFYKDEDMSSDVLVTPDGKISLPLINEVEAAGLTLEQLRLKITDLAVRYFPDPSVTVIAKQINSRLVYIMGSVGKGGPYSLMQPTTVLQLIALAGGLGEWAKEDKIVILRTESGKPMRFNFNYKQVLQGKNPQQNILLKPGDTVLVP